jgi:hypothetical protein
LLKIAFARMSQEVETVEDCSEGLAGGGQLVAQRADTHAGEGGHSVLRLVLAIGEKQDGLMLFGDAQRLRA